MFEQEGKKTDGVSTSPVSTDVVIHTMPKEFYGQEASLVDSGERKTEPLPVAPPPPPVAVAPVALPPAPVIVKRRSWTAVILVTMISLAVLAAGGYGAHRLVTVAGEQRAAAEAEVKRLQQEAEAKDVAAEEARRKAAADAAAAAPTPGKDSDSDGLTDVEELLYGTNFRDPDTDKDSYLDGNEVFHRYHPLGNAPETLLDTGAVKVYADAAHSFTLYYPATWNAVGKDSNHVVFTSSRQASMSVTWDAKSTNLALVDWLKQEDTTLSVGDLKEILTKEGYYGYTTQDDRTSYLNVGEAVVTLTYDLGGKTQIEYLQTFQMMVNSFVLSISNNPVVPTP